MLWSLLNFSFSLIESSSDDTDFLSLEDISICFEGHLDAVIVIEIHIPTTQSFTFFIFKDLDCAHITVFLKKFT